MGSTDTMASLASSVEEILDLCATVRLDLQEFQKAVPPKVSPTTCTREPPLAATLCPKQRFSTSTEGSEQGDQMAFLEDAVDAEPTDTALEIACQAIDFKCALPGSVPCRIRPQDSCETIRG